MTRNAKISPQSSSSLSLRLLQRLSWISSLGVLSSFALAQTPASSALKDLVIPEPSAPPAAAPSPVATPLSPTPAIAPPELTPVPSIIPAEPTAPIPTVRATPSQLPSLSDRDDGPVSVVLSERSTGCQTEVQFGSGLSYGPCGEPKPVVAPTAITIATRSTAEASSFEAVQAGPATGYDGIGLGSTPQNYYQRTVRPVGRLGNGNISLIFPLAMPAPISSMFGWRVHPITGDRRFHSGTDLAAPQGTPVLAAYAGQVAIADFMGGYGLAIALNHNQATQQTLYAHLSEIFVKPGEQVKQGDVIGRVGSTGNSTGPHLHFEFRQLTSEGWVAMDAGTQLEVSLAQLVKVLEKTAQNPVPRS
jgi:Peptidase family M23